MAHSNSYIEMSESKNSLYESMGNISKSLSLFKVKSPRFGGAAADS